MHTDFISTLEGSTFWKFLTTEMTRSVTSDLNEVLTSSEKKRRRMALKLKGEESTLTLTPTFTLRYFFTKALLAIAAIAICKPQPFPFFFFFFLEVPEPREMKWVTNNLSTFSKLNKIKLKILKRKKEKPT